MGGRQGKRRGGGVTVKSFGDVCRLHSLLMVSGSSSSSWCGGCLNLFVCTCGGCGGRAVPVGVVGQVVSLVCLASKAERASSVAGGFAFAHNGIQVGVVSAMTIYSCTSVCETHVCLVAW